MVGGEDVNHVSILLRIAIFQSGDGKGGGGGSDCITLRLAVTDPSVRCPCLNIMSEERKRKREEEGGRKEVERRGRETCIQG